MQRASVAAAAVLLALSAPVANAQDHQHPPGEQLGTVRYATTCSAGVTSQFERGMALLHSFEFGESIRAFTDVLATDSTCAMAHWGISLSQWGNPMAAGNRSPALLRRGKASIDAAMRLGARASERERGYIRAASLLFDDPATRDQPTRVAAYERAMRALSAQYPADTEAVIFHAIALTASASPTDKTYAKQLEAGAILESLWAKQPDHPGLAHYIIHSYDYPALAGKARNAAQRYARIAPSAAHALHMPSHTFTRVGMWEESINTNKRSMETAVTTGSFAEALHAADYSMYAWLQLGNEVEAKAILDRLPSLAARFDPEAITGAAPGSAGVFALASIPARWALERRSWTEAAALEPKASAFPHTEAMTYFARALGASRAGGATQGRGAGRPGEGLARAKASIDSLASIRQRLSARGEAYWAEQVAIQHLAATAWLDLAERRETQALARMREAAAREDATEKSAVTPGPLVPMHELLGDMLLELGRPTEALAEYRATLEKEPGRRHAIRSIAALAPRE